MGTQRTPPQNPAAIGTLLGLRAWTGSLDSTGGGYDVLDLEAGPVVAGAETSLALEASGTPTIYNAANDLVVEVVRAGNGGRGADVSGVAFENAGGWFGRERFSLLTGYQEINDYGADNVRNPSAVALDDGTIVLGVENDSDNAFEIWKRTALGVWSLVTTLGASAEDGVVLLAPDGSLHAYVYQPPPGESALRLSLYRSTDNGATWTLQRYDCTGVTMPTGTRRIVGVTDASGGVVLFVTHDTGTSTKTTQYASGDGGYRFTTITSASARSMVYGVTLADGFVHAVTVEYNGSVDLWYHRKIAVASTPLLTGARVQISNLGSFDEEASGFIIQPEPGVLLASFKIDSATSNDLFSRRSEDNGETWLTRDVGPAWVHGATALGEAGYHLCGVMQRQTALVFCTERGNQYLHEVRYGGTSSVTIGTDAREMDEKVYWPSGESTKDFWGWTNTDTGTVTRTVDTTTGERVAAGVASSGATICTAGANASGVAMLCVRPINDGTENLCSVLFTGNTDTVRVDLRATVGGSLEIRTYDAGGAAPAYTTIGNAGDFTEIAIACQGAFAYVWWRKRDNAFERDWSIVGAGQIALGAASFTASRLEIRVVNGDTIDILHAWASWPGSLTLHDGFTAPDDLMPIPISPRSTYLSQGVSVRHVGGLAKVDGVAHGILYTSPFRGENIVADLSPSPSTAWRSATEGAQVLSWSLAEDVAGYVAVYVGGLRNIETLTIDTGAGATACSTTTAFRYDCIGNRAIRGSATATTPTTVRWVRADELAGCQVKLASGTWRTIVGNTEGWLRYGAASAEYRATIYLDGQHDSGTNKAGSLVSSSLWLITDDASDTLSITVPGTPTNSTTGDGYRQIGVVAPFALHVLGLAPDLDDQWSRLDNADVQTMPDGKRYTARRSADRRRVRVAYVGSGHEVRQQEATSTTGDYVVVTSGGRAAGDWTGIPYTVEGIVARAAGQPVLWLPSVPDIAGPTAYRFVEQPIGKQALYGRIVGGVGFEGIPLVGARGVSQMFRVPAVTIEEEL